MKLALILEDDIVTRLSLKAAVKAKGYRVLDFESPFDLNDQVASMLSRFDIIITDNNMPKMTGVELTAFANGSGYPGKIYMQSTDSVVEKDFLEAGGTQFFSKKGPSKELMSLL